MNDIAAAREGGTPLLASVSDDGCARLWDSRVRHCAATIPGHYPLLACAFVAGSSAQSLFCAGVEGVIRAYDLRALQAPALPGGAPASSPPPTLTLEDSGGGVSSLATNAAGDRLLSLAFDGSARAWDVQAFCASPSRCVKVFGGGKGGGTFEGGLARAGWSPSGERVCVGGGGDRLGWVWDYASQACLATLPGHMGAVPECAFHPSEPVIATCGGACCVLRCCLFFYFCCLLCLPRGELTLCGSLYFSRYPRKPPTLTPPPPPALPFTDKTVFLSELAW